MKSAVLIPALALIFSARLTAQENGFEKEVVRAMLSRDSGTIVRGDLPVLETGSVKPMPAEWVDKQTGHRIVRLSALNGNNSSFYFHNNPFSGNKMAFYHADDSGRQLYTVDLKSRKIKAVTAGSPATAEILSPKSGNAYYQVKDSVFVTNLDNPKPRLVFVFPADFKATISTVNADETLLAGRYSDGTAEREILKQYPEKSQFFNRIFDARIPNTLFTISVKTGELKRIHTENTWLGHVQFSPADPALLMFCHEGPWHKVDRIWTIDVRTGDTRKMHSRTMDMEIAGHEFFSPDGKFIWFDQQLPKGSRFYLSSANVATGEEKKYELQRDEWSIHFNISHDQKRFAGDGGDPGQVAKAANGTWIYLFHPEGDKLRAEKLVNMKAHGYKLEPNVHFSPDDKWVIFRANFEGSTQIYAVETTRLVQ
jgi:oligogalacturonide lyase